MISLKVTPTLLLNRFVLTTVIAAALFGVQVPASAGKLLRGAFTGLAVASIVSHAYAASRHTSSNQQATPREGGAVGDCTRQLPMGRAPTFSDAAKRSGLHQICYEEYTVAFSEKTRTPLWSAEHLTAERILAARRMPRKNTFHEEPSLPADARSQLKDFVRSGYDRGHMSPSGDFSNASSQNETFSLANMVPQEPNNNRHLWEGIESGTRNYAVSSGSVYVITGPLFVGKDISFLNNRVAIPTQIFKLLYDPVKKTGGVYLVDNVDTQVISWLSIADFERRAGMGFGIGAPALMTMPKTSQHFPKN